LSAYFLREQYIHDLILFLSGYSFRTYERVLIKVIIGM
jgi:hypothetical protein